MKAVVLAYHDIGCVGIEALLSNGIEIAAVFTHVDDPQENLWFHSVAELAAARGIPVFAPEDINHPLWVRRIKDMAPDILFSFYYRKHGQARDSRHPAGRLPQSARFSPAEVSRDAARSTGSWSTARPKPGLLCIT